MLCLVFDNIKEGMNWAKKVFKHVKPFLNSPRFESSEDLNMLSMQYLNSIEEFLKNLTNIEAGES